MPSRLSYVWLSQRRGLTPFNMAQLLRAFGSPDAVFAADRQALTAAPCALRKAQVDALCDKDTAEAEEIIERCARADIRIITLGDSAYPDRLRAIEDPPVVLYVRCLLYTSQIIELHLPGQRHAAPSTPQISGMSCLECRIMRFPVSFSAISCLR